MNMPETVKIRVHGKAHSATRMDISARHHTIIVDEPEARHGTDQGPLPLETFLAAYASCTNVIGNWIADDLGIHISDMKVDLEADFDTRSAVGMTRVLTPFPVIRMVVQLTTSDGNRSQIDQLKEDLKWRCPVSAVIRAAGTEIDEEWRVTYLKDQER